VVFAPLAAAAQSTSNVPTRPIGNLEVEFREPFTAVHALRELRDGRAIVADHRDKTLQLLDLTRGTATPVGRSGAGPAEWGNPGKLYALPGDTTLMVDFSNDRFLFINPDGKAGATVPFGEKGPFASAELVGSDASARLLLIDERHPANPRGGTSGIADVLRYDRKSGRVDTVGTLALPKGEMSAATMLSGGLMRTATNLPLAALDAAAIAADGRIVIVRAVPYRVEFIAPNGQRTVGPTATPSNIRVTDEEKEAFMRSQIRPGAILVKVQGAPTPPSASGKAAPGGAAKVTSAEIKAMMNPDMIWPAIKPPFLNNAVQVAPDGRVWVLRTRAWTDSTPMFDVFDATGRVVERVTLPKRTRLVGFGNGVAYVARTDDDDLIWLQRVRR
jgi:hypothetical protein